MQTNVYQDVYQIVHAPMTNNLATFSFGRLTATTKNIMGGRRGSIQSGGRTIRYVPMRLRELFDVREKGLR